MWFGRGARFFCLLEESSESHEPPFDRWRQPGKMRPLLFTARAREPRERVSMLVLVALAHEGFCARGAARGSRLAGPGLKQAAHPRCTVADGQAGDAMGDELRRRLFVEREPDLVPFGLRESYSFASGALASMALHATPAGPSTPWVLLSMALALLCDFGPSARRDVTSSVAASLAAANDYVEAGPQITLGGTLTRALGGATAHCLASRGWLGPGCHPLWSEPPCP